MKSRTYPAVLVLLACLLALTSTFAPQKVHAQEETTETTPSAVECDPYPTLPQYALDGATEQTTVYYWESAPEDPMRYMNYLIVAEMSLEGKLHLVFGNDGEEHRFSPPESPFQAVPWWGVVHTTTTMEYELKRIEVGYAYREAEDAQSDDGLPTMPFELIELDIAQPRTVTPFISGPSGFATSCSSFLAPQGIEALIMGINPFSGLCIAYQGDVAEFSVYSDNGYFNLWAIAEVDGKYSLISEDSVVYNATSNTLSTPAPTPMPVRTPSFPANQTRIFRPAECDLQAEITPEATAEGNVDAIQEVVRFRLNETTIVEFGDQSRITYGNSPDFMVEEIPYVEDWFETKYQLIVSRQCLWLQTEDGTPIGFDYQILAFRQREDVTSSSITLHSEIIFDGSFFETLEPRDGWQPAFVVGFFPEGPKLLKVPGFMFGNGPNNN